MFIVQFDYILEIMEEFPQIQLVYGVYRQGVQVNEPKLVDIVFAETTNNPKYMTAFFDNKHSLLLVKPHPDTMLIIEFQVPDHKDVYTENKMTTADKNSGEINNMKTYAWTCIDLFTPKRRLKEGAFKVPFYTPPTALSVTKQSISKFDQIEPTMLYVRVMKQGESKISEIICNISYKSSYVLHDIHDFEHVPVIRQKPRRREISTEEQKRSKDKVEEKRKPPKPMDHTKVHIHYVKGIVPDTHLRVAWCLQVGDEIIAQDNGSLCFFATKGIKANNITARGASKAATVGDVKNDGQVDKHGSSTRQHTVITATALLEFNEAKTWIRDVEALCKNIKGEVFQDAYVIIQLLEK